MRNAGWKENIKGKSVDPGTEDDTEVYRHLSRMQLWLEDINGAVLEHIKSGTGEQTEPVSK